MSRATSLLVLLVALMSNIGLSVDLKGYGKTTWGMTVEQVLIADERAHQIEATKGNSYADGSVALAQIDEVQVIPSTAFNVKFVFNDRMLTMVSVNSKTGSSGDFDYLEQALTEKYGQPAYKNASVRPLLERTVAWNAGSTKIELNFLSVRGTGVSFLTVVYRPIKPSGDL